MENILWNTWQYLVDVFDCFLILYLFRKMMRTRLRQPKYYYLFLPVLAAVLFACNCWLSGMIGLGVMTCVYAAFSLLLFRGTVMMRLFWPVPFPVSWTVKMKKKQKETQDILSYHTQAAGCSDKARAKASGGRQPIEECGRTGL